jgi:hypothetical protein
MSIRPTRKPLVDSLLLGVGAAAVAALTGWFAVAFAAGCGPVVIATRAAVPEAESVAPSCDEPPAASTSETYRELEELARLAARREWQERVEALERQLEREQRRADAAAAARQSAPAGRRPAPLAIAPSEPLLPRAAAAGSRRPRARVSAGAAKVQLIGSDALVTGTLRNAGDRDTHVRLVVELLLDQRVLDRARLRLLVPARGSVPWSRTFPTSLGDGTYAARVRLDR